MISKLFGLRRCEVLEMPTVEGYPRSIFQDSVGPVMLLLTSNEPKREASDEAQSPRFQEQRHLHWNGFWDGMLILSLFLPTVLLREMVSVNQLTAVAAMISLVILTVWFVRSLDRYGRFSQIHFADRDIARTRSFRATVVLCLVTGASIVAEIVVLLGSKLLFVSLPFHVLVMYGALGSYSSEVDDLEARQVRERQ